MSFVEMAVMAPLLAAGCLAWFGQPVAGARANLAVAGAVFLLTILAGAGPGLGLVHADGLALIFGGLTGLIGLTIALGNVAFVNDAGATLSLRRWRGHHALFQAALGLTLLGLYADNIGLLWLAVEGLVIAAALGVWLHGGQEAAWRCGIVGAAGVMLALFGTLFTYLAAQPALGPGLAALSFAVLETQATLAAPMRLAFLFLLLGYGACLLAPLQKQDTAPTPLTAMLQILPLNVALLAILRFSHLARAGMMPLLVAVGLGALLLAGILMISCREVRRLADLATIAAAGLALFAFGIGGGAAIFGGLLVMILHTFTRAGLLQALRLPLRSGWRGWLRGGGVFALSGLPPSGLFVAQYLIVSQTVLRAPLLAAPLLLGLLLCGVAILRNIGPPATPVAAAPQAEDWTAALLLLLSLIIAYAMPAALIRALSAAAGALQ